MKKFIYLLAILATSANAQTIKTLGYNTTNGQVSYSGTNFLTFTNVLQFSTNTKAATRTNLELGGTWLTNTNVTNFRTDIGLGISNTVQFSNVQVRSFGSGTLPGFVGRNGFQLRLYGTNTTPGQYSFYGYNGTDNAAVNAAFMADAINLGQDDTVSFGTVLFGVNTGDPLEINSFRIFSDSFGFTLDVEEGRMSSSSGNIITWDNAGNVDLPNAVSFGQPAVARTNLGLGLPALTNTSNVTTMRALAGSTNTNEPYSGTVALTNTNVLTFSNGVLLKIQ